MWPLFTDAPTTVPADWWTYLAGAGTPGLLAIGLIAFAKGWIVPAAQYREVCEQRDQLQKMVDKLAESSVRTLEALERKVVP